MQAPHSDRFASNPAPERVVPEPLLPGEDLPASALVLQETLTRSGVVMGTPHYMSPEQFRGDALDGRSDQFSFCASL